MHDWHPQSVVDCTDSPLVGYATIVLGLTTCCWYCVITMQWLVAAKTASREARVVWRWLMIIFVVCAIAGYGSMALSLVWPAAFAIVRLTLLVVLNIACPMFLQCSIGQKFQSISKYEGIGQAMADAVQSVEQLDDKKLASLARQLVEKSLERACR